MVNSDRGFRFSTPKYI